MNKLASYSCSIDFCGQQHRFKKDGLRKGPGLQPSVFFSSVNKLIAYIVILLRKQPVSCSQESKQCI